MLLLFTTPHCSKCTMTKFQLDQNNIPYQEVFAPENMSLVEKYQVSSGGTLVDDVTGLIVQLSDIIEGSK